MDMSHSSGSERDEEGLKAGNGMVLSAVYRKSWLVCLK